MVRVQFSRPIVLPTLVLNPELSNLMLKNATNGGQKNIRRLSASNATAEAIDIVNRGMV